jgi:hypothetical protein
MRKIFTWFLVFMFTVSSISYAQNNIKIKLGKANTTKFEVYKNRADGFQLKNSLAEIKLKEDNTKHGNFIKVNIDGLIKTFDVGSPELPVLSKLIEVPIGADVTINVLSYEEEVINLNEFGLDAKIIPAQASVSKSADTDKIKFYKNEEIYSTNRFYKKEIAIFENSGIMRDKRFGRIEISPLQYNPVDNELIVLNNIVIDIKFTNSTKSIDKKIYSSPYFLNNNLAINFKSDSKEFINNTPVKYVIVSDRMFEETLQAFIDWKRKKGFQVITAYTDVIGYSTTEIHNYLENLYNNPPAGESAPSFVLFVGDIEQIPAYSGSSTVDEHVSDLYYCEYTGDRLPEVYYGRFSASSVDELIPQLQKTLTYEKYELPDPSYLADALMIAGEDATWAPTHGNGTIRYATENYINETNGINSYLYYYYDNSGVLASNDPAAEASIISRLNEGVGFANYTAHCMPAGWSDPSFEVYDIDGLQNIDKYGLLIGNCCLSNKFDDNDCFGEQIVKIPNKGALAYIGASNSSLWDEDFWWSVGLTSNITANPSYIGTGHGAFDGLFHQNGEDKSEWYVTQGQIITAGNLAVEASTSGSKTYYWEIYHLMGDPSITNYIGTPDEITVELQPQEVIVGMNSFIVNTIPNAYIALSLNGELLDVEISNDAGVAELTFDELTNIDVLDLVITAQNKIPYIEKINILPANQPYIINTEVMVDDSTQNNNGLADYGENISLNVKLKNITQLGSGLDAYNVVAVLTTEDQNVTILNNTDSIDIINAGVEELLNKAFDVSVNNNVTDQHIVNFNLEMTGDDGAQPYIWNTNFELILNAPTLSIGELTIDDSEVGDNDGILDTGETANILIDAQNLGHADINNISALLTIVSGSEWLTINNSDFSINELKANTNVNAVFNVTSAEGVVEGTPVKLRMDLKGGTNQQYNIAGVKTISVGVIPEFLISQGGTVNTCLGLFYDSGADGANYSNNENYKITLMPEAQGSFSKVNFLEFDVEESGTTECYDVFYIYDGVDEDAELIYSGCKNNPPGVVTASNSLGALTFAFESDYAESRSGWKAEISCIDKNQITFNVMEGTNPIVGATILIDNRTIFTDENGKVIIGLIDGQFEYSVFAPGYNDYSGLIDVNGLDKIENITLVPAKYNITFKIINQNEDALTAKVTFDGSTKNTTNGTVTFTDVLYELNKLYVVECDGYGKIEDHLDITGFIQKTVTMTAMKYDINFVITENGDPLNGAFITINDDQEVTSYNKLTGSDGLAKFNLPNGNYIYEVSASGYSKKSDDLIVNSSTIDISVEFTSTAIEELDKYGITIYPNPSNGKFYIRCEEMFDEGIISIIDISGRIVYTEKLIGNNDNLINISDQSNGMYLIRLNLEEKIIEGKILLKK